MEQLVGRSGAARHGILVMAAICALAAGSARAGGSVTSKDLKYGRQVWHIGAGLSTAGWIVGGTGIIAGGGAIAAGIGGGEEASPILGSIATGLFGVGVPLAGLAGGWARAGCASIKVSRLSKAPRVTGWIFYGLGMAHGIAATIMGFAEVPWGGEIVGGIGLAFGIGALVLLQIDAHSHLYLLQQGLLRSRGKVENAPRRPLLLVVPLAGPGGSGSSVTGAAALLRW